MWRRFAIEFVGGVPIVRIPVGLSKLPPTSRGLVYVEADVDFGLPCCLFSADLAQELGLQDWKKTPNTLDVAVRGHSPQLAYLHEMSHFFRLSNEDVEGPSGFMGFAEKMPEHVEGILGRDCFFGRYQVLYELMAGTVSVEIADAPAKPPVFA